MKKEWKKAIAMVGVLGALSGGLYMHPARADDDTLQTRNKIDEDVQFRDYTGLTKLRSLAQSDIDKDLGERSIFSSVKLHATLRASYDATEELNSDQYGAHAGSGISFTGSTPGSAFNGLKYANGAAPVNLFGAGANPGGGNFGVVPLSQTYRKSVNGIDLAVPVRPCNLDSRGCISGYMDANAQELRSPEFNSRLDFLRELYADFELPVGDKTLAIRVGRQQLVWGRTDLFRVLDVVNPVDLSRNNIYDELEDIRIPMGMLRADYRMGAIGPFDDLNIQGVWTFEDFRPNNLGQAGGTNTPLNAANVFRAFANCWQNGCTVNNFTPNGLPVNFGPHQIGIRQAVVPTGIAHDTFGGKIEGELKGVGFSLNALQYQSQMPSLRGGIASVDPFGPPAGNPTNAAAVYPYALAFDIHFPRVTLWGASLDYASDRLATAFRLEVAYTQGEEFANTARSTLYSASNVFRYVIGADRNTFIRFLNPDTAFLISGQIFGTHLMNYELRQGPLGPVGMPDFQDNWIGTLLVKGWYRGQTISPQIKFAHDFKANASVIEPAIDYLPSNSWKFTFGANCKFGKDANSFDDNSSAAPYPNMPGSPPQGASAGWGGMLPLGMFRTGVLGMAHNETQLFANASYRF